MFGTLGGLDSGNFAEMQQQVQRELLSNPQVNIELESRAFSLPIDLLQYI